MTDASRAQAAQYIAQELREIVGNDTLAAFVDDESGMDSLRQYERLVRSRLGGDYHADAWEDAMEILRVTTVTDDALLAEDGDDVAS